VFFCPPLNPIQRQAEIIHRGCDLQQADQREIYLDKRPDFCLIDARMWRDIHVAAEKRPAKFWSA